jgi:hypothetical protein
MLAVGVSQMGFGPGESPGNDSRVTFLVYDADLSEQLFSHILNAWQRAFALYRML